MKKIHPIFLSITAGIILWLSWPISALTAFIFFGFIPLLRLADIELSRPKFFGHVYLALFIWNVGTTWWIWNSTDVGSIAAIAANSLLMCLPWLGYRSMKLKFGKKIGYISFISFWMLFEYIHLNWQLSWPWLSLGNVFASQTFFIQWYEYTGVGGGTLLILIWNVIFYEQFFVAKPARSKKTFLLDVVVIAAIFFLQAFAAIFIGFHLNIGDWSKAKNHSNIIIVQPNIDPYSKFENASVTQQIQKHLQLCENQIDSNTRLVIWPETALSAGNIPIDQIQTADIYKPVFDFVNNHPNLTLLTGIETIKWYGTQKPESPYARKTADGYYYDSYNAAVSIKANQPLQFYIKSKLVPGVETLPTFLNFLGPVFEKFGGTTGGYAKDTASIVFKNEGNPFITAPIICYESIYGEYVSSYVAKGANLLTIMTNDGWWGNTPGHKQHLQYARLRAIETRTWIARSANTGISAVINNYGEIIETQPWNTAAVIKYNMPETFSMDPKNKTFYVAHGDYLYRIFSLLAGLLVLYRVIIRVRKKFNL